MELDLELHTTCNKITGNAMICVHAMPCIYLEVDLQDRASHFWFEKGAKHPKYPFTKKALRLAGVTQKHVYTT